MSKIRLETLAHGAVAERIDTELSKVLENLRDPNTDPKKPRKLTVTLTLKGNDNRDVADVTIQTKSTLVPTLEIETKFILDQDTNGQIVGAELKSGRIGQHYIDEEGDLADDKGQKIYDFRKQTK